MKPLIKRRLLFIRTFLILCLVRLGLAFISFQRLRLLLARVSHPSGFYQRQPINSSNLKITVRQVIWAVEKSVVYMPGGAKCLAKALTTQVLLDRRGICCKFKIGVAKSATGDLEAHAWIEFEDQVIMGSLPDLSRFKSLPPLQTAGKS